MAYPWTDLRLTQAAEAAAESACACAACVDVESLVAEVQRLRDDLTIAMNALRDIGSRDIIRSSDIAWTALEQIEGSDDAVGEALERQRQPENQR